MTKKPARSAGFFLVSAERSFDVHILGFFLQVCAFVELLFTFAEAEQDFDFAFGEMSLKRNEGKSFFGKFTVEISDFFFVEKQLAEAVGIVFLVGRWFVGGDVAVF